MRIHNQAVTPLLDISFWLLIAVLAGNLMYKTLVSDKRIHAAELKRSYHPIPFTTVIEDVHYDSDGKPTSRSIQKWAVRSDGANMIEVSTMDQAFKRASRFVQLPSGEHVQEDLILGTKSTTYYEDGFANSWIRTPSSNCLDSLEGTPIATEQVMNGAETIDGLDTVKISLGQISLWFAPKYGCALIKATNEDGTQGRNEQRLVSLTPGEPAPALFEVSSSLKEVNPSTAESMQRAAYCNDGKRDCTPTDSRVLKVMDDEYNSHQAH